MTQLQLEHASPPMLATLQMIHHRTVFGNHASGGASALSGTSGFTSVTTLSKSSMTLSPVLLPASLICFSCSSASLLASSSAFLLPLVCYSIVPPESAAVLTTSGRGEGGGKASNLLFEFFELVVFLLAVVFYFFLRFVSGVFDALGSVWSGGRLGGLGIRWVGRIRGFTFSSWEWVSRYTSKIAFRARKRHTSLDYPLSLSLGLE